MRKLLAIFITIALLLSLSAIVASAELPEGLSSSKFARGVYCVENPEDFMPVGTVQIQWDEDASDKLDLTDGDMSDWANANYEPITISAANMVAWEGKEDAPNLLKNWGITTFFVADSEWLYIGFYVDDTNVVYGTPNEDRYSGDSFQICIDFGNMLGDAVRAEPEFFPNPKNIFYSFCCYENDPAIRIKREESEDDRWLTEANGDGVKGAAIKTITGWSAEFALSWEMLHADYEKKAWLDDSKLYVGGETNKPLQIGCCLYYLNGGDTFWAAGTTNGITDDTGTPGVSWTCFDNGINLELPITEDVEFDYDGIVILKNDETQPPAPETEEPTDAPTDAPTDPVTDAPTDSVTDAPTADVGTDASTTDDGCASIVGLGAATVLMAAAAVVALKKKD